MLAYRAVELKGVFSTGLDGHGLKSRPCLFVWASGKAFNQLKRPEPENMSLSELGESHAALSLAEEVGNGQRVCY